MKEINYEKRLDALEELETLYKFRKEAIFKDMGYTILETIVII